jgi:hypothetical protein
MGGARSPFALAAPEPILKAQSGGEFGWGASFTAGGFFEVGEAGRARRLHDRLPGRCAADVDPAEMPMQDNKFEFGGGVLLDFHA